MDTVPDRVLVFLLIPEMFVAETPFRSKIVFYPVHIGICRNTAHIGQGCFAPVICIAGAEIPSYIFQVQACFAENLIPAGNKLADMGAAGKIVIFSSDIAVPFNPDPVLIGFQGNIQLWLRPRPARDLRSQVVPPDLRLPG